MKLHILSDLHLEFAPFDPPATDADVVVLAGDISQRTEGIRWARRMFAQQQIIFVPGNHEYYGAERITTLAAMREAAAACGVHLLDNDAIMIQPERSSEHVRFLGCTLWTDFRYLGDNSQQQAMTEGQKRLSDFHLIRNGTGAFTPERSVALHEQSLAWLKNMLATPFAGKTVVVTHHLPSANSVAARFRESSLSPCFVSRLDDLFGKMTLWIHGHTHDSFDYQVSGTRVVCNPRGYVTERGIENAEFKPGLTIEI